MLQKTKRAGEALMRIDREATDAAAPHSRTAPVKALSWYSEIGDQPQMRMLGGGLALAGLLRRDPRMARAGVRMLLAHELATAAKNIVKHRVDRLRPRSAEDEDEQVPEAGRNTDKEHTSFPSGHSAGATAVARALAREYPELQAPALVAAGLAAGAQVPRTAHYPTDVAAGIAVGLAAEIVVDAGFRTLDQAYASSASRRAASSR